MVKEVFTIIQTEFEKHKDFESFTDRCNENKRRRCRQYASRFIGETFEKLYYHDRPEELVDYFLPYDECVECLFGNSLNELLLIWRIVFE